MNMDRFDRNEQFFGKEGQERLRAATVAVVGVGGLGTHVVQQLALLGVGGLNLIDGERLDHTNRNRYVGAFYCDPVPGSRKVDLGERLAKLIDPSIKVHTVFDSFISEPGFAAIQEADYIFGCLDDEGARLVLSELCAAYLRPYIDLASDVVPGEPIKYGGRVCTMIDDGGCLVCLGVLDVAEATQDLADPHQKQDRDKIYGVRRQMLGAGGPSVVAINGVVASLGVTEFMVTATGLRRPQKLLTYYGYTGKVTSSVDAATGNCWYCKRVRGQGQLADVERYIRNSMKT